MNWQTPLALGIVVLTLLFFLRALRSKKKSCGGDCGCSADFHQTDATTRSQLKQ